MKDEIWIMDETLNILKKHQSNDFQIIRDNFYEFILCQVNNIKFPFVRIKLEHNTTVPQFIIEKIKCEVKLNWDNINWKFARDYNTQISLFIKEYTKRCIKLSQIPNIFDGKPNNIRICGYVNGFMDAEYMFQNSFICKENSDYCNLLMTNYDEKNISIFDLRGKASKKVRQISDVNVFDVSENIVAGYANSCVNFYDLRSEVHK